MDIMVSCGVFLSIFGALVIGVWISALRRNKLFEKAIEYINEKNSKDAIPYLNKALSIWPNPDWLSSSWKGQRAIIHSVRGNCYMKQEQYKDAQGDFNRAINVDPKSIDAYIYRGINLYDTGRLEEALQDMNTAVDLLMDNPIPKLQSITMETKWKLWPVLNRAMVHNKMGHPELALKDYDLAKQLVPALKIVD